MILCGVLARVDITTAKIRSCICMGSGLFLEGAHTAAAAAAWTARLHLARDCLNCLPVNTQDQLSGSTACARADRC